VAKVLAEEKAFCTMSMSDTGLSPQRIGYARVSSVGQNLDALQQAGCAKVFMDTMTGARMDRPGWQRLLEYVHPGDTLVVTELSRMTHSLRDLFETKGSSENNLDKAKASGVDWRP